MSRQLKTHAVTESVSPTAPQPPVSGKLRAALEIMRFHKPIGTFLLMAPTLWGVILANEGQPSARLMLIFVVGVVVMRAQGVLPMIWQTAIWTGTSSELGSAR